MAENTAIEWADDSVNFWWGCTKISPGCHFCYAETLAKRYGWNVWGPKKPRRMMKNAEATCRRLNRKAEKEGKPRLAFTNSMSDFFEDHPDLEERRREAFQVIDKCSWLRFLILTKRPENIRRMWVEVDADYADYGSLPAPCNKYRSNVWLGTSVENQQTADERIPELLKCRDLAPVLFLSAEPLLGPVDLRSYLPPATPSVDWVIVGGES